MIFSFKLMFLISLCLLQCLKFSLLFVFDFKCLFWTMCVLVYIMVFKRLFFVLAYQLERAGDVKDSGGT